MLKVVGTMFFKDGKLLIDKPLLMKVKLSLLWILKK